MMKSIEFKSAKAQRQFWLDMVECGIHPMNISQFNYEDKNGNFHYTTKVTNLVNNITGLAWED